MSIEEQFLHAASRGNASQVKRIVKENKGVINVNATDEAGSTALQLASQHGSLDVVTFLAHHPGIDLNLQDKNHETALILAAKSNRAAVVKELLSKSEKINVNLVDNKGSTALHWASFHGFTRIVHLLLGHADIETFVCDFEGKTAFEIAGREGHVDVQHIMEHRLLEKSRSQRMLKQQSSNTIFGLGASTASTSRPSLGSLQPLTSSRVVAAPSSSSSSETPSRASATIQEEKYHAKEVTNVSEMQRRLKHMEQELAQSKLEFAQLESLNAKLSAKMDLQASQMGARLAALESKGLLVA